MNGFLLRYGTFRAGITGITWDDVRPNRIPCASVADALSLVVMLMTHIITGLDWPGYTAGHVSIEGFLGEASSLSALLSSSIPDRIADLDAGDEKRDELNLQKAGECGSWVTVNTVPIDLRRAINETSLYG